MMALHMKNREASYYQSAPFCRHFSFTDTGHYLARFPVVQMESTDSPPAVGGGCLPYGTEIPGPSHSPRGEKPRLGLAAGRNMK
ncbi:unnamed protein product [Boreogadus saida]